MSEIPNPRYGVRRDVTWIPKILLPSFTWPARKTPTEFPTSIPPTPRPSHYLVQRFWAYVHSALNVFGGWYSDWLQPRKSWGVRELPFGLILKWSCTVTLEQILTTQTMRAAGFPAPLILNYGFHPQNVDRTQFRKYERGAYSMLMLRLPGYELPYITKYFDDKARQTYEKEMKQYLDVMRGWKSPWGDNRICSIAGTTIKSHRVPFTFIGPCESLDDFHDTLSYWIPVSLSEQGEARSQVARRIRELHRRRPVVKFTHGDFGFHNLLLDREGHITAFIDWECSGWLPEYWEFVTPLRSTEHHNWWTDLLRRLGLENYEEELICDHALRVLTGHTFEDFDGFREEHEERRAAAVARLKERTEREMAEKQQTEENEASTK